MKIKLWKIVVPRKSVGESHAFAGNYDWRWIDKDDKDVPWRKCTHFAIYFEMRTLEKEHRMYLRKAYKKAGMDISITKILRHFKEEPINVKK